MSADVDQNEALAQMRRLVELVADPLVDLTDLAGAMATAFRVLDGWLAGGGMLPNAWLMLPTTESVREADLRRRLAAENGWLRDEVENLQQEVEFLRVRLEEQ